MLLLIWDWCPIYMTGRLSNLRQIGIKYCEGVVSKRVHFFVASAHSILTLNMCDIVCGFWKFAFSALFWAALQQTAVAHDATLRINRTNAEDLELTFSLDLITTLQGALAPRINPILFLGRYAHMPTAEFNDELARAKSIIENEIRIEGAGGNAFVVRSWQWPASEEIQARLKKTAEASLSDPSAIGQLAILALTMSAHSKTEISRIHLSIGPRLRPILLVRPNIEQFWIDDLSPDVILDF